MISMSERIGDPNQTQESHWTGRQARVWTALPAIIQSFDAEALTCDVQPAIQGKQILEDGTVTAVNLPLLLDCPVVFPHAGGCSLTFPIKSGDECLVVFSARAIDFWWQQGGVQPPAETRMHDLSDGFVIPGPWSQATKIKNVSTEAVELRSDDRKAWISIHPTTHEIHADTTGNMTAKVGGVLSAEVTGGATLKAASVLIDSPSTHITGTLTVDGLFTGKGGMVVSGGGGATVTGSFTLNGGLTSTEDVVAGGISLMHHVHTEQGDGSDTSGPH